MINEHKTVWKKDEVIYNFCATSTEHNFNSFIHDMYLLYSHSLASNNADKSWSRCQVITDLCKALYVDWLI